MLMVVVASVFSQEWVHESGGITYTTTNTDGYTLKVKVSIFKYKGVHYLGSFELYKNGKNLVKSRSVMTEYVNLTYSGNESKLLCDVSGGAFILESNHRKNGRKFVNLLLNYDMVVWNIKGYDYVWDGESEYDISFNIDQSNFIEIFETLK